tara:strand:- start:31 stop:675 length:645 start_codon:yes stop_codon:yes gene_type:complete
MNDKKTSLDFELTRLENLKNDINESTKKLNKFFKEFKKNKKTTDIEKYFGCFHHHVERIDKNMPAIFDGMNKVITLIVDVNTNITNVDQTKNFKVDTKLGVATAYELFRMKKYIVLLDDEDPTHKRIKYSIKRLEDAFHDRNFRIENYEGEEYQVEKNLKVVNRIDDENIPKGKKIISRMLKPTIFYDNKVHKRGEIEIKVGTKTEKNNRSKNV